MANLAGSFYFSGAHEDILAEHVAEQMNCLNGNGLHPDVTWQVVNGTGIICARTDSRSDAKAVGSALTNIGIIREFDILDMPAAGTEGPYFIIAVDLTEIDRGQLEEELTNPAIAPGSEDELDEIFNTAPPPFRGPVFN